MSNQGGTAEECDTQLKSVLNIKHCDKCALVLMCVLLVVGWRGGWVGRCGQGTEADRCALRSDKQQAGRLRVLGEVLEVSTCLSVVVSVVSVSACVWCVVQILAHVPPLQRERVAQVLMAPGYLRKLLDLFRVRRVKHITSHQPAACRSRQRVAAVNMLQPSTCRSRQHVALGTQHSTAQQSALIRGTCMRRQASPQLSASAQSAQAVSQSRLQCAVV